MRESPASAQAYRQLAEAVRRGVYGPGTRLPAERSLAGEHGVSRATLRNALRRLADEGLLESVVGSGWFVTPEVVGEPPSVLQSFSTMARARGMRPTSRVLTLRPRAASSAEAEQLRTPPGTEVLELVRLRGMDDTLICLDTTVLPLSLVRALVEVDLTDRSLYDELEQRCGLRVERSSFAVQAEAADREVAERLGVDAGWPVLVGRELGYDGTGRPVLLGRSRYRGDAYRFTADLFRPR